MTDRTLIDLFREFPLEILEGEPNSTIITNVVADSREIQSGDLFVATIGENFDAHNFIPQAINQGCSAVVGMNSGISIGIPYIRVPNSRQALAYLSAAYYDFPAKEMTIIGVTGTDGKTTTCSLIFEILVAARLKTGMITTVNAVIGDEVVDTGFHVTTPDSPVIQKYLSKMVKAGVTHVVLETTSHGWSQFRVDACEIDIGVVTNITHEHLDEHGSYRNYFSAKAKLFESLANTTAKPGGNPPLAILNFDDGSYKGLKSIITTESQSYGLTSSADVYAMEVECGINGITFFATSKDWKIDISSNLVGIHNVFNCLAALTVGVIGLGINTETAAKGIKNFAGIAGRMEQIDLGQNFTAIVDFAHTPNALKNAIETARTFTDKRIITIFGSAGLRDREKRRMMAEISVELADLSIFTAEDPRTESVDDILAEMAAGARGKGAEEGKTFWCLPHRGEAIRFGISLADEGDVVMACGKGHEQSMCFGETEYPWDDRTAVKASLSDFLGLSGPKMPFLPTQSYH